MDGGLLIKLATVVTGIGFAVWLGMRFEGTVRIAERAEPLHGRSNMRWNLFAFALLDGIRTALGYTVFRFHTETLGAETWLTPIYLGGMMATYGVSSYLWGVVADRFGNRRIILLGAVVGIAAIGIALPFLSLVPFLVISLLQFGLTGVFRIPLALVSEWTEEQAGEGIGILHACGYLLSAMLGVAAGNIYVAQGMTGVTIVSTIFYIVALVGLWGLAGPSVGPKERSQQSEMEDLPQSTIQDRIRQALTFEDQWVPWILIVILLVAIPRGGIVLTALNYVESTGVDLDLVFVIEAWAMLLNVLLFAFGGILCDRFGAERVLAASAILYMIIWCAFSIGLPGWIAVAVYVIPIVGLFYTSADALLARHTSEAERNRGLGIAGWAMFFGQFLGTMAGTGLMLVIDAEGVDLWLMSYRILAPLFVVAGVMSVWLARRMIAESEMTGVGAMDAALVNSGDSSESAA